MAAAASAGVCPAGHKIIEEGTAKILFSEGNEVFYNPVQVLNRDLSIQARRAPWRRHRHPLPCLGSRHNAHAHAHAHIPLHR